MALYNSTLFIELRPCKPIPRAKLRIYGIEKGTSRACFARLYFRRDFLRDFRERLRDRRRDFRDLRDRDRERLRDGRFEMARHNCALFILLRLRILRFAAIFRSSTTV